jgi:hypothetical protein
VDDEDPDTAAAEADVRVPIPGDLLAVGVNVVGRGAPRAAWAYHGDTHHQTAAAIDHSRSRISPTNATAPAASTTRHTRFKAGPEGRTG